jgi:hypothetical protein
MPATCCRLWCIMKFNIGDLIHSLNNGRTAIIVKIEDNYIYLYWQDNESIIPCNLQDAEILLERKKWSYIKT